MVEWCKKYDAEQYAWLNMLFDKQVQDAIVTVQYLLHKCLKCEHETSCIDKYRLVGFLESNDNPNDHQQSR